MIYGDDCLAAAAIGAVGFLVAGWLLGFAHGYARCWLVTREAADENSDSPDVTERIRRRGRDR